MKKLSKLSAVIICVLTISIIGQAQEISDTAFITPTNCLAQHRHFISVNTLQFATGTANLNYECKITPQFSMKVGVGTLVGTRILFNEAQMPCIKGGKYGTIEARYYFKKASESCLLQYGLSAAYKYWNFVGENVLYSSKELNERFPKTKTTEREAFLKPYKENNHYNVTDDCVYEKEDMVEHLIDLSFFGKGCIAGGLTAEMEVGVGLGVLDKEFYFTPNLGLSFGWTFGKIKEQQQ